MGDVKQLRLRSDDQRRHTAAVLRVWADRIESGEVHALCLGIVHGEDKLSSLHIRDFTKIGPLFLLGVAHMVAGQLSDDVIMNLADSEVED